MLDMHSIVFNPLVVVDC